MWMAPYRKLTSISMNKEGCMSDKKDEKDTELGVKLPQCVFMAFSCYRDELGQWVKVLIKKVDFNR